MRAHASLYPIAFTMMLAACDAGPASGSNLSEAGSPDRPADAGASRESSARPFEATEIARFDEPWAMTFVDKGHYALVTEKTGRLFLIDPKSNLRVEVNGVPEVDYGGQGGLGDVVAAPDPDPTDKLFPVYLSWVEAGEGDTRGAVVAHADLLANTMAENGFALRNLKIIWRQRPKVTGRGHFSHRIAVAPDERHIFISSGERQKGDPAQDMQGNLGKIIRLNPDGSIPAGNPLAGEGGIAAQIWTLGHRNVLGLAFDDRGRLWASEMGPRGGDEVNLIHSGDNYGWPRASNGSHYDGRPIPDHGEVDGYHAPEAWWNPSISPAGMAFYDGSLFPRWRGSLLLGALSGRALVRLKIKGDTLVKTDHWPMKARIREVEVGPDGAVWLLEDGPGARLLRLTPARQDPQGQEH